ncbi:MAG TPA: acylphosphatase, partial [Thermoanaerobaculia bacterium]|nr:acylphosphatase [Thermoanaerobaculia bacterium]
MRNVGRHIEIRGIVQGVGFRPWVHQLAVKHGVTGRVRNDSSGVIIDAFGGDDAVASFMHALESSAPPAAQVRDIACHAIDYEPAGGFTIVASERASERNVSIPPDLATCDD